jgi:predicted RNA binding protein YcfA (HicA-like mRNA interferase family)
MKIRQMVKELEAIGYVFTGQTGGHMRFEHPDAIRPYVISNNNEEIGPVQAKSNIKKAMRQIAEGRRLKQQRG